MEENCRSIQRNLWNYKKFTPKCRQYFCHVAIALHSVICFHESVENADQIFGTTSKESRIWKRLAPSIPKFETVWMIIEHFWKWWCHIVSLFHLLYLTLNLIYRLFQQYLINQFLYSKSNSRFIYIFSQINNVLFIRVELLNSSRKNVSMIRITLNSLEPTIRTQ